MEGLPAKIITYGFYAATSNQAPSSVTASATETYGADGLVSACSTSTSASTFYTFDERGNVAQRLDKNAAVLSSDMYDAYGGQTTTGSGNTYGFGGQAGYYTDGTLGLILCTHRYYDPVTGRWLTRDLIGYRGGINLYGYVGNDPVNRIDPTGFDIWGLVNDVNVTVWSITGGAIGASLGIPDAPVTAGLSLPTGAILGGALGAAGGHELTDAEEAICDYFSNMDFRGTPGADYGVPPANYPSEGDGTSPMPG